MTILHQEDNHDKSNDRNGGCDNGRCARPHDDALRPQPDHVMIIRIFDHQDDSFIFDTTKWPTFKWQPCDNVIDKEPDESDEGPQSVKDISVVSSRL